MLIGLVNTLALHCPWFPRSSHSWTQLSQDDWNMEKEKKQNNPQQPNTLAVAHVDSACQFSQSHTPNNRLLDLERLLVCVCTHVRERGRPRRSGGCNRKASCTAGSRCVDLAGLAAKPRPLEKHGLSFRRFLWSWFPGLS